LKEALYFAIFISQLLCGLATVTSASRMIFAFSRDGGLPASKALATVSVKYRTPIAAIWTASILSVLFVWLASVVSVAGTSAYTIVVSCTVIFLFFSFAIPIVLGMFAWGTSRWPTMGPWNMGRALYMIIAVLVILAMILIFVIGIQPPNQWALNITVGFVVIAAIVWFAFENRRFKGPPVGDIIKKKQAEIAAIEAKFGEA
jgi:amino acid transporter